MENVRRKSKMIEVYSVLFMDMLCIILSYALSLIMYTKSGGIQQGMQLHFFAVACLLVICLMYNLFLDGNRNLFTRDNFREFGYAVRYTCILVMGLIFILFVTKQIYALSRLIFGMFTVLHVVLAWVMHVLFKKYMLEQYRKSDNNAKMMLITNVARVDEVVNKLKEAKTYEYELTAVAVYDEDKKGTEIEGIPVVATAKDLYDVVCQMMVDEVFICLPGVSTLEIREMVQRFEEMGLICHYNVDIFSHTSPNTYVQRIAGYSVISFARKTLDSRRLMIKRLIDILGSLVGIILTCMITPFVALAIKIESPGPVFFSQTRIGKNGRRFKIWKFRSMYIDAEERKKELEAQNEVKGLMFKMENDPRITKVGKFIRKTSIDETPQFFNIFMGDMSLIGTRPPTVDEFEQYNGYYRRRLSITPGLTGMWQVSGRSDIQDFDEIVKLDLEYIDNWSLALDVKILFMTVYTVLLGKGSK